MKLRGLFFKIVILLIIPAAALFSQSDSVDYRPLVINNPSPGYIFLAPYSDKKLAVLDNVGTPVFSKNLSSAARINDFKYRFNKLWYAGGTTYYYIYSMDEDMNLLDSFLVKPPLGIDFHDFQPLENGHFLMLAQETRTVDMSKVVTGGKTDASVIGYVILELDKDKKVVFQWKALDHFQITDATEAVKLTASTIDPFHCNSIEQDSDGNILLSSRTMDEVTKINRSNGEIIWRLGGEKCKNNQFTFTNDTVNGFRGFSHQHDVRRLTNGHITMYDNGSLKPGSYSRAVEYEIDETNKTLKKVWEYRHSPDIFSSSMGSVQRFPNGNTLICWGTPGSNGAIITEVTPGGDIAYEAASKNITSYKAYRFVFKMNAVTRYVNSTGNYSFNEPGNSTGLSINANPVTNNGYITVEKHFYKAHKPDFPEGSKPVIIYDYRWMITRSGSPGLTGTVKFDMASLPEIDDTSNIKIYKRNNEGSGEFTLLSTSYNAATKEISAPYAGTGEYILASNTGKIPALTHPENNAGPVLLTDSLAWTAVKGADKYRIQIATSPSFDSGLKDIETGDSVLMLADLANFTEYYWHVKAVFADGESDWSQTRKLRTVIGRTELLAPADGAEDVRTEDRFMWNSIKGAINYEIQISLDPGFSDFGIQWQDGNVSDTMTQSGELDQRMTYYWRVRAKRNEEKGGWSQVYSFMTADKTSAEKNGNIYENLHAGFYPNPASDKSLIELDVKKASFVTLKIYNINGSEAACPVSSYLEAGSYWFRWDSSRYPAGIYFYMLTDGDATVRGMIMNER